MSSVKSEQSKRLEAIILAGPNAMSGDDIANELDVLSRRLDATEARLGACPICSPLPFPTPAAVERAKAPATEPIIGPRRQDHIADPGNMVEPPPPADGAEEMAASADTSTQDERRLLAIASQIVAPLRALSDKRVPPYPRLIGQLQHTITDALTSHAAAKTRALREELEKVKRAKESLWHSAARLADELDAMKARAEKAEGEVAATKRTLDTEKEMRQATESSLHNLARYCENNDSWAMPMAGHAVVARDTIRKLRDRIDTAEVALASRERRVEELEKGIRVANEQYGVPENLRKLLGGPSPATTGEIEREIKIDAGKFATECLDWSKPTNSIWLRMPDDGKPTRGGQVVSDEKTLGHGRAQFAEILTAFARRVLARAGTASRWRDAVASAWEQRAITLREEAGRIRRTVKQATGAEERCNVRAEVLDACVAELRALPDPPGSRT